MKLLLVITAAKLSARARSGAESFTRVSQSPCRPPCEEGAATPCIWWELWPKGFSDPRRATQLV